MIRTSHLVLLSFVSHACGDTTCDDSLPDIIEDVTAVVDADTVESGDDVASEADGFEPEDCLVDPYLGRTWGSSFSPNDQTERLWFVLLSDGYLVGQFVAGSRASSSCFELAWDLIACTPQQASVRAHSFCSSQPIDVTLELERSELQIDGFPTILVNGQLYEVLFDAHPSNIDQQCAGFECSTTWTGVIF